MDGCLLLGARWLSREGRRTEASGKCAAAYLWFQIGFGDVSAAAIERVVRGSSSQKQSFGKAATSPHSASWQCPKLSSVQRFLEGGKKKNSRDLGAVMKAYPAAVCAAIG